MLPTSVAILDVVPSRIAHVTLRPNASETVDRDFSALGTDDDSGKSRAISSRGDEDRTEVERLGRRRHGSSETHDWLEYRCSSNSVKVVT